MSDGAKTPLSLAEFSSLVETYGADRTRWPLLRRHGAEGLLAHDPSARSLLADAEALNQLLDKMPSPEHDFGTDRLAALTEAIVARAQTQPRIASTGTPILTVPAPSDTRTAARTAARSQFERSGRNLWGPGALVAASLIAGLYVGQAQLSAFTVPAVEELAGYTLGGEARSLVLASFGSETLDDD